MCHLPCRLPVVSGGGEPGSTSTYQGVVYTDQQLEATCLGKVGVAHDMSA